MHYDRASKTITHIITDDLSEEDVERLAAQKECSIDGERIRGVTLLFVMGLAHARDHFALVQRFGLECRAVVNGEIRVLSATMGRGFFATS